jgi:transcriptional regulator with XRE-family HTH domain
MNIQIQLGSRIRELRVKKGLSQEEFADVCGLHRSHMGEIERGRANITLATLVIIAQTLQTTPSALFKDLGVAADARSPGQAMGDPPARRC